MDTQDLKLPQHLAFTISSVEYDSDAKISRTIFKLESDKKEDCSNFRVGILQMFLHHFQSFSSILPLLWFRLIALKSPQIRQNPLNLQNPLSPLPLQPKPFTFTQILNHPDTSKISFHFGSALLNFNLQTAIIFNFWGTPIHQFSEKILSHNSLPHDHYDHLLVNNTK